MNEISRIKKVYKNYKMGDKDFNYRWHPRNFVSITYRHLLERKLVTLLNRHKILLENKSLIDVGCGDGGMLEFLLYLSLNNVTVVGQELLEERAESSREKLGSRATIIEGSAESIDFPDNHFDLVFCFTVFSSILDDNMRKVVAKEMSRIVKPGGHIIMYDMFKWTTKKQENLDGFTKKTLKKQFEPMRLIDFSCLQSILLPKIAGYPVFVSLFEAFPIVPKTNFIMILEK